MEKSNSNIKTKEKFIQKTIYLSIKAGIKIPENLTSFCAQKQNLIDSMEMM